MLILFFGRWTSAVTSVQPAIQPSGGWGFFNEYETEQQRRQAIRDRRQELIEKARKLEDDLDRALAIELQHQEAERERQAELTRIKALVERYQAQFHQSLHGERIMTAVTRAVIQGNYSALEAVDRELARLEAEEMFLMDALAFVVGYG